MGRFLGVHLNTLELRGPRLRLRPWEHGDVPRLVEALADPRMRAAVNAGFARDGVRARRLRNPDGTFSDEVRFALVNPKYA